MYRQKISDWSYFLNHEGKCVVLMGGSNTEMRQKRLHSDILKTLLSNLSLCFLECIYIVNKGLNEAS